MTSTIRALVIAAFLVAAFGSAPRAQTSTGAEANDAILAKIAALEQQIDMLKAQLQPTPTTFGVRAPTLAEASAEAKRQTHEWPVSHQYTSADVTPGTIPAPSAPPETPSTEPARQEEYRRAAMKDEMYWKDRMQGLRSKLDDDRTLFAAANTHAAAIGKQLELRPDRVLRAQWEDALAEASRLKALVTNDVRAIATAEEEARRANVPPGWLRP